MAKVNPLSTTFEMRAYTRKELTSLYGIPRKTFSLWIKPYAKDWGIKSKKYFTPAQVKLIIEVFGVPGKTQIA